MIGNLLLWPPVLKLRRAEDVDIADVNNDGHLDVVVAAELAHLIYFQNPQSTRGVSARSNIWPRVILPVTTGPRILYPNIFCRLQSRRPN